MNHGANRDFKRIELAEVQKADIAKWAKVIKTADIKLIERMWREKVSASSISGFSRSSEGISGFTQR